MKLCVNGNGFAGENEYIYNRGFFFNFWCIFRCSKLRLYLQIEANNNCDIDLYIVSNQILKQYILITFFHIGYLREIDDVDDDVIDNKWLTNLNETGVRVYFQKKKNAIINTFHY